MSNETVWIDIHETVSETERAVLFGTDAGEVWIPKSQMKARRKDAKGTIERLEIPRWLAVDKGLADEKDER